MGEVEEGKKVSVPGEMLPVQKRSKSHRYGTDKARGHSQSHREFRINGQC